LRDEHGYTGGDTIVKDYVRLRKLSQREMFVPLEHPPGDAQADFGEAMVGIAGVERKAHYLVMDLPQSDDSDGRQVGGGPRAGSRLATSDSVRRCNLGRTAVT
jgi:transposase